jgi:hypothetical protein
MKAIALTIAAAICLSAFNVDAGRDGAQLMLQDQLNKRAAAERGKSAPTADDIRACEASARRVCPTTSSR